MPDDQAPGDSVLEFACPDCGATERDEFEVIAPRSLARLRCWGCSAHFGVWLDECRFCGEELLVTLAEGAQRGAAHLPAACPACHAPGAYDEALPRDVAALA